MKLLRTMATVILLGLPFCARAFTDGALVDMSILMKIEVETAAADATLAALAATDAKKYIFVSTDTHDGDFASGYANGIAGADAFCAAQKTAYYGGLPGAAAEYAALIMDDGTNRRACTTANCTGGAAENVDWVLAANTTYSAPDGATLFTTDSSGIFDFGGGSLDRAFDTAGGLEWWTGRVANDWIADANFNCTNWTVNVAGIPFTNNAYYGVSASTAESSLSQLNDTCDGLRRVLCVRR